MDLADTRAILRLGRARLAACLKLAAPSCCSSLLFVDPSSFLLGALLVSAKALGIGAVGFGIAWWRARNRIRQLDAALERLAAGQSEIQRRLPPPRVDHRS